MSSTVQTLVVLPAGTRGGSEAQEDKVAVLADWYFA